MITTIWRCNQSFPEFVIYGASTDPADTPKAVDFLRKVWKLKLVLDLSSEDLTHSVKLPRLSGRPSSAFEPRRLVWDNNLKEFCLLSSQMTLMRMAIEINSICLHKTTLSIENSPLRAWRHMAIDYAPSFLDLKRIPLAALQYNWSSNDEMAYVLSGGQVWKRYLEKLHSSGTRCTVHESFRIQSWVVCPWSVPSSSPGEL